MVTNASLWWGMLKAGEAMHVYRQGVYGKFMSLPLSFAVYLKLLLK